ncbi:hypothetical protein [Winogradskyella ursingii]|uniref:hypothetical protein n=1 Tax=Winogradskyella ursingii TaxID=2686079 RepID=UPI0015CE8E3D|nr:hypothetical protein [Winogradskyella ursingii]
MGKLSEPNPVSVGDVTVKKVTSVRLKSNWATPPINEASMVELFPRVGVSLFSSKFDYIFLFCEFSF